MTQQALMARTLWRMLKMGTLYVCAFALSVSLACGLLALSGWFFIHIWSPPSWTPGAICVVIGVFVIGWVASGFGFGQVTLWQNVARREDISFEREWSCDDETLGIDFVRSVLKSYFETGPIRARHRRKPTENSIRQVAGRLYNSGLIRIEKIDAA